MAGPWTGRRRAARAALLMLTVLGLFGMHGLPDAMASSGGAMATSMTMPVPVHTASSHTYAPMGCAMDHTNCVAVQREAGHLTASDVTLVSTTGLELPIRVSAVAPTRDSRAPPNVSLIELEISRT